VVFGHKSLALDRLDAPALSWDTGTSSLSDTQRLMPGATLLGYNRGRTTNFGLGRFLQADPNASGLALQSSILFHGVATSAFEATVSVQTRLGDGLNLFGYLRHNPVLNRDPSGLLVGLILPGPEDIVMAGFQALRGGLEEMIGQYGANMESDLDWALDWSQGDDWHSRKDNSWVEESFSRGFRKGLIDSLDPTGGLLSDYLNDDDYAMAGSRGYRPARMFSNLADKAKYLAKRAHHWIPQILGGAKRGKGVTGDLEHWQHSQFHTWLDQALVANKFPRLNGGLREWNKAFKSGPNRQRDLRRVLYDTTKRLETELRAPGAAQALLKQIREQRWLRD
jgi:hypothetical protein